MKVINILNILHICFGFTGLNGYVKPKIKTKQIATIGPVCSDYKSLSNLHSNGVNIFRINLSHESQISLVEKVDILNYIRSISPYNLEILLDLQGPKHRIGKVRKNTIIKKGNNLLLDKNNIEGDEHRVYLAHDNIYKNNGNNPAGIVVESGFQGADILWDVTGYDNNWNEPNASKLPPILPKKDWSKLSRLFNWRLWRVITRVI